MTTVTPLAHVCAIPTTPTSGHLDAIAAHFAIVNALRAALVYVGKAADQGDAHHLHTATARAHKALALLQATPSGRA